MDLIDRGLIDTVELDLKDEAGVVSYDSAAAQGPRDRRGVGRLRPRPRRCSTLEDKGIRVIGRLVAFRDPIYAEAAWAAGHHDEVLQTPSGDMLGTYGGFANYANPAVRAVQPRHRARGRRPRA